MVQFTSRSDLQVIDFPEDSELNLLVRVLSGNKGDQKFFGVRLKGTRQLLSSPDEAARHLRPLYRKKANQPLPKYGFPVVVLLFSMQNDRGFYSWQIEPIIDQTKEPRLKVHDTFSCSVFDRASLDSIVKKVNDFSVGGGRHGDGSE